MRNHKVVLGLIFSVWAVIAGWNVAACFVANAELKSDMQDLAAQNPVRIGLAAPPTEQELRDSVIARAKEHGIELAPQQVRVDLVITPETLSVTLEADYEARVNLLVYSFALRFTPSGSRGTKASALK